MAIYTSREESFDKGKMQTVIEEAPDEVDPTRDEHRPQQTQLAMNNERHVGETASSPLAGLEQRQNQATIDDELPMRFSRPMSRVSAMVPPLNVSRAQRDSARCFYAFQHPASPHSHFNGSPGILVPHRSEQLNHLGLVTSSASPTVINNAPLGISGPSGPERHLRAINHTRHTPSQSRLDAQAESLPCTAPNTAATARAQETALTTDSPFRHAHQHPHPPRDVGSYSPYHPRPLGPHESEQLSRIPTGNITQRRADVGPATSRQHHRALSGHHEGAQKITLDFRPPSSDGTHVVRFREPDLIGLIARGVIKVNPESHPPARMLQYAPVGLSSHKAGVELWGNAERRTVELRHSAESVQRNRSCKAKVEGIVAGGGGGGGRRGFSSDSGYYTASSGLLSASTVGLMSRHRDQESFQYQEQALPPSCQSQESLVSSGGERRILRRRSPVPELSSRFRMERGDELDADDEEGSQGSSLEDYVWDEMGPLGMTARAVGMGRRFIASSVSSVDIGETKDDIV